MTFLGFLMERIRKGTKELLQCVVAILKILGYSIYNSMQKFQQRVCLFFVDKN